MGTYIYGIVISAIMIGAGLSGLFSDGGSIFSVLLVVFGAFFLIVDVTMFRQAQRAKQQAPQANSPQTTETEAEAAQTEANDGAPASEPQQEAAAETVAEAPSETAIETPAEEKAEDVVEVPAEAPVDSAAEVTVEAAAQAEEPAPEEGQE